MQALSISETLLFDHPTRGFIQKVCMCMLSSCSSDRQDNGKIRIELRAPSVYACRRKKQVNVSPMWYQSELRLLSVVVSHKPKLFVTRGTTKCILPQEVSRSLSFPNSKKTKARAWKVIMVGYRDKMKVVRNNNMTSEKKPSKTQSYTKR